MRTIVKSQKSKAKRPFSRAISRSIFVFILYSLSAAVFTPIKAQEAFYIYRNDGDFNGFFYDEVVEIRQSKIGVDSIEYDKWVTQEVVLADTTYRIPLAAIDSIGFQQPEIKFNPRVKFMEQEGLCPYLGGVSENYIIFNNLPAHLVPQVGDVLIGLPTDSIAWERYNYGSVQGSFSLVIEEVAPNYDGSYWINGHPITNMGEVFEQYITVEEIAVDSVGKIRRRIAGCTPDGLPRKMKNGSGDSGDIYLINFDGTLTHSWDLSSNSAVDLSADVGIKVKLRVAYDISWTKFIVKMTKDMSFSIKPSVGVAVKADWIGSPGKFLWMPEIVVPAAAPFFRVNPLPDVFLKVSGSVEGRFNLPKVQLGLGDEVLINSNTWFPVSYTLHTLPDEDKEADANIFDFSTSLKMSGALQMGIEFQALVGTASWIKKILSADIGLHLYTGPKLSGEISYDSNVMASTHDYWMLSSGKIDASLLALDLEAGATAGVSWSDPEEVTFFTKSWDFMTSTFRLVPPFKETEVMVTPNNIVVRLHPESDYQLLATELKIGLFDEDITDTTMTLQPIDTVGNWTLLSALEEEYEERFPVAGLKSKNYAVYPIVTCGDKGEYAVTTAGNSFIPNLTLTLENDAVHFNAAGNNLPAITIISNVADPAAIRCTHNGNGAYDVFRQYINVQNPIAKIDTLDLAAGKFKIYLNGEPNDRLWAFPAIDKSDTILAPLINVDGIGPVSQRFSISQDENPLQNMQINSEFCTWAYGHLEIKDVAVSRPDSNTISLSGTYAYVSGDFTQTQTLTLTLTKIVNNPFSVEYYGDPSDPGFVGYTVYVENGESYDVSGSSTIREYDGGQMTKNGTIYLSGGGSGKMINLGVTSGTGDYGYLAGAYAILYLMWDYVDNLPE